MELNVSITRISRQEITDWRIIGAWFKNKIGERIKGRVLSYNC